MALAASQATAADDPNVAYQRQCSPLKKTWTEIRQAIHSSHRGAHSVLNRVPHALTLEQTPAGWRLYFLCVPSGQRENTILYLDFSSDSCNGSSTCAAAEWRPLLSTSQPSLITGSQMSREEQLLRERKRLRSFGITSYDYQYYQDTGHFAYPAANSIFVCSDHFSDQIKPPLSVTEVKTKCVYSRLDPKLCPTRPDLLAFISGQDLWATCVSSGCERRLTFVHKGLKNLSDDPLTAGAPSFVVQEEFDRYTGYWWQPVSTRPGVYQILYEEVDEEEVDILYIVSPQSEGASCDQYRYPKAGASNAKCTLKIVEFRVDAEGAISDVVEKKLTEPLSEVFPSMEYIVRAGWLPDGSKVYAELLNRCQTELQLVVFDLSCFTAHGLFNNESMDTVDDISPAGSMWIVQHEVSNFWTDVHDLLYFMSCSPSSDNHLSFIWGSARSGFMHLYLVTVALDHHASHHAHNDINNLSTHPDCMKAPLISQIQLTDGDWVVDSKQVWVDEAKCIVYFIGYKDTPLETHLYFVSLQQPGVVTRLTRPGFTHSVTMDKSCKLFVTVNCSLSVPTATEVFRLDHTSSTTIIPSCICTVQRPSEIQLWKPPEIFHYQSVSGFTMYGMMYLPNEMDKTKKYPVVLFVYAGPHVQLVTNSYKAIRFLRLHTLASLGYVVVVIDSRGSANRGVEFEAHIHSRMGTVEVADQVEGLLWLASKHSFIDMDRVAIHGWSYGGYVSLLGLIQRPDIFKVAVAGAPVTSWELYDTGYTERYLGLPTTNCSAYTSGSILSSVDKFPNEEGRLLIVHGLIDENVHFYHTSSLIDALIKAGKPHHLQIYPNERHGMRSAEANEHFETLFISFLQKNL